MMIFTFMLKSEKVMYGLKEAGIISYNALVVNIAPLGYRPYPVCPGIWKHDTHSTAFTIAVDECGIKYSKKDDLDHLLGAIYQKYTLSTDLSGSRYC